jgi:hypothetical protein
MSRTRRAALRFEELDTRAVPAFLAGAQLVVAADAESPPLIRLIDPTTGVEASEFLAFDPNFFGGVRVAVGDVNGDGHPDLIAAAGPGGGPAVKVYDGATGAVLSTFFAYAPSFTGGVNVAAADLNGDGKAEVITGAGGGGGPQVNVFDGATGAPLWAFFAYDPSVRGGVRVAAGDLDGDGKAEIVTGPGFGGGPDVRTFNVDSPEGARLGVGFFAFDPSFVGGVYPAVGDLNGDGKAEIAVGAGAGGGPQVSVFTGGGARLESFFPYAADFRGGVRVGMAELTGDGRDELVTGPGPTGAAQVNVYEGLSATPTASLFGFPIDRMMGVFVSGSPERLAIPSTPASEVAASYAQLEAVKQAARAASPPVVIPMPGYPVGYYPWWGLPGYVLGFGFGFGPVFYDAPALFAPYGVYVEAPPPPAPAGFYAPYEVAPAPSPADFGYYYDPTGSLYDPGYYDPSGYLVSPGYYDTGYSDYGYSDYGFYYDPGFYFDDF